MRTSQIDDRSIPESLRAIIRCADGPESASARRTRATRPIRSSPQLLWEALAGRPMLS